MTGNSEGTSTDLLVNGKLIYFLRLFCFSPKCENGNEFYFSSEFVSYFRIIHYINSFRIKLKVGMCCKVPLDFVVSSVAVVFVRANLKVRRLNYWFSKNTNSYFFPKFACLGFS